MKVLYVLGRGRSGSTVFANILGELDGFFAGGEIRCFWDPVVVRESMCGCGLPVGECPVWSHALRRLSDVDVDEVAAWQHEIVREHQTYRLLRQPRRSWATLERYAQVMGRLYQALAEVTGARVIVDSSKRPSYAAFLRSVEGVEPHYVHLVREPRASAYSWQNRRHQSSAGDGHEVTRRGALNATLRWDLLNLGSEAVIRKAWGRSLQMRFEDFVAQPRRHVELVRALVDEPSSGSPFVDEHTVLLGANHTIAGNPSRFVTGPVRLEDKREWRDAQTRVDRWITTAVALPFLRRYGYPIHVGSAPAK
ncbi:MAG TPA: sulfotransferase [Actinomycetota bacterium]|nr:sulfotransferase [Actinomycetota bacterium]